MMSIDSAYALTAVCTDESGGTVFSTH